MPTYNAYVRKPGTPGGPCENEDCGHKACEEMRKLATSKCPWCGQVIGYETRFVKDKAGRALHRKCVEEEKEQRG